MAKDKYIICLSVFLLLNSLIAVAQYPAFRKYTMRDGLSQMKITDLHLDSRGYLWIGTRNGLNKFNGESFEIFTSQDGLSHDRIHNITEDLEGRLVLLTYRGVDVFDGAGFRSFPRDFKNVLYDLAINKDNDVLICEKGIQRKLWILKNDTFKTLYHQKETDRFISLVSTPNGQNTYFSNGRTLFSVEAESLKPLRHFENDIVVFKGVDEEPYLYNKNNEKIIISKILADSLVRVAELQDEKTMIKNLAPHNAWIQNDEGLTLPGISNNKRPINKLTNVRDVLKDEQNQFWIASDDGLTQVFNEAFYTYPSDVLPNIWTVTEDHQNNIWFGSFGEGLYYKPEGKDTIIKSFEIGHCFAGSDVDNSGKLFFAHEYNMAVIDGSDLSYTWDKTVFSLKYDKLNEQVVFGTFEGVGVFTQDSIHYLGPDQGLHDNGYIQNIGFDKDGNYWAGSYTGISKISPGTYTINNYTQQNGKLPCSGVFCSYLDKDGHFWMGGDNGLLIYDPESDSVIPLESQVVNSRVKSIEGFDDNHLIMSTKEGIYIFDKKAFLEKAITKFYFFNGTNGFLGIDPGFTGIFRDSDNQIWICSATNLVKLDRNSLLLQNQELNPIITHINDRAVGFRHDSIFNNPYGMDNVVFTFEATGLNRQFNTKYQYKLDNGPWSKWLLSGQVLLNDLEPGKHSFMVRAGPTDLPVALSKTDIINFNVSLPFYQYAWFPPIGIGIALILLGTAGFYFFRQRREHFQYIEQLKEARYLRSQLLLAELNPHFIFNVLASIQHKVLFEKKEQAADYVVKLSKLMRNYLNATHKANQLHTGNPEYEIPLQKEIELLTDFIDFEIMKNDDHFSYHLEVGKGISVEFTMIPPLLIQPFVENAIKHGLLLNEKKGNLWITFIAEDNNLVCVIEDDGIGIEKAEAIKKQKSFRHTSLGSKIVRERIELLNKIGYQIELNIEPRIPSGTRVCVTLKGEL